MTNAYTVVSANPNRLCLPMSGSFCQIQSTSNAAVSGGPLLCSQSEQSLKSRHGLVTLIMAKNELIEVNLELRAGILADYGERRPRHAHTLYVVSC